MSKRQRHTLDVSKRPFADIAARLRWHRVEFEGLQQAEYAAKAGIGRTALSNWETGDKRVSIDAAMRLRLVYGTSLDWLYCGDAESLPASLRRAWRDAEHPDQGRDWLRPPP
ncbi:helix-turn-helix domain-containing protein [Dinoroseobacter sp. S124A]|uniref:helix-turn-helix domain-containing protein n=1 Tax=Dinoroseobacter sp. S124A TaxID=3415128 RepID=UPI003C7A6E60